MKKAQLNSLISISSAKSNEKNNFVECRLWYVVFEKKCSISIDVIKRKVVNCCKQRTIVDKRSQSIRLLKFLILSIENVIERKQLSKNSKFNEVVVDNKLLIIATINCWQLNDNNRCCYQVVTNKMCDDKKIMN